MAIPPRRKGFQKFAVVDLAVKIGVVLVHQRADIVARHGKPQFGNAFDKIAFADETGGVLVKPFELFTETDALRVLCKYC